MISFPFQYYSVPHPALPLLVAVAICFGSDVSHAQSTSKTPASEESMPDTTRADSASPENPVRANPAGSVRRDRSLESLSELLKLTDAKVRSEENGSSFQENATDFRERNSARAASIQERILLIRQLINQEKEEAESRAMDASPKISAESSENVPPMSYANVQPQQPEPIEPAAESAEPSPDEFTSATVRPSDPDDEPPTANASDWETKIATEPVDSFELATSLFMTGNYHGAKKTCEARLKSDVEPDEEAWLRCLIGCCQRMIGDYEDAEASFRDVTNSRLELYPVDYAKWNLGYLRQREEMKKRYSNVTSTMDEIVKKAKMK